MLGVAAALATSQPVSKVYICWQQDLGALGLACQTPKSTAARLVEANKHCRQ